MSQDNITVADMIESLTLDQTIEIYKYYVKGQIFHTRTTYDSESNPDSNLYAHDNLVNLLPSTDYKVNGIHECIWHRIFDDLENALPNDINNIVETKNSVLQLYYIFNTVDTGHPKFDNKMRKIGDKLRNKLLSLQ